MDVYRKRSKLLKNIKENNIITRRKELNERLLNMNIDPYEFRHNILCHNYINYGESTIDIVCNKIEMDLFLTEHTNYKQLLDNYKNSKKKHYWSTVVLSNTEIEKVQYDALEEYVITNKYNIHKILTEIPWSLKKSIDLIFNEM